MTLGLILSSSDFNVMDTGPTSPASNFIGGENGTAGLNSSLSDPITNTGDFNRTFAITSDAWAVHLISSSVDSSLYSGSINTSKAYSARAWVRLDNIAQANLYGIGVIFMTQDNEFFDGGAAAYTTRLAGYSCQLSGWRMVNSSFSATQPCLSISANGVSGSLGVGTTCTGPDVGTTNGYAKDTWYRIRFDMIPAGAAGVTLNAYTSSAGDVPSGQEVWELVGTQYIDAVDSYYIDPTLVRNSMGFYAFSDNQDIGDDPVSHIDQFEILVEDI